MCKVISVISCKGGVGKTTSAVNISSYIQMQGKRVCAVDLDPQHNLSKHFGIYPGCHSEFPTVYDLLYAAINEAGEKEVEALVRESICQSTTVDVIPSTEKLASLETIIPTAICQERLLEHILSFIKKDYDYIFLDCHPGLDVFSKNALAASDSVIIPVEAHILSSDGLDQVERMIRTVQRHLNKKLKIEGVIITKYQGNTNYCKQISELVMRDFGDHIHVFDSYIKYAIKVAEAPVFGLSLHEYTPGIEAAKAYANIAREVMQCG